MNNSETPKYRCTVCDETFKNAYRANQHHIEMPKTRGRRHIVVLNWD